MSQSLAPIDYSTAPMNYNTSGIGCNAAETILYASNDFFNTQLITNPKNQVTHEQTTNCTP